MNTLTTDNLAVGYAQRHNNKTEMLSGLNLSLPVASVTLLVGANGSGKSTLLRTLAGTQVPLEGKIEISGKDLHSTSLRQRARLLSLVYTDRTGGGGLTVGELVSLGRQPFTGFIGHLSRNDRHIVDQALQSVGIAHKSETFIAELSDGERQKAMIARALAQQTPLIILDEPTSFLDIASRIEILQLLSRLATEGKKTILLSSHDLSSALSVANRLWIIDPFAHSIIQGDKNELIDNGFMDRIFPGRNICFDPVIEDFKSI